jgi:hypothetical protein
MVRFMMASLNQVCEKPWQSLEVITQPAKRIRLWYVTIQRGQSAISLDQPPSLIQVD